MNTAICSRISTYYFFLQVLTRCKFQNYLLIPNWLIKRQHYDVTTSNSKGRGREGSREKEIHILTKWSFGTYIVVPNATWDGFWMKSAVFQRVSFHYTVNLRSVGRVPQASHGKWDSWDVWGGWGLNEWFRSRCRFRLSTHDQKSEILTSKSSKTLYFKCLRNHEFDVF